LSCLILRTVCTEYNSNSVIYYSLIGSVNTLIKNILLRDKLVTEKEILYFEIETAGLINSFFCIVIRNICNYTNIYKNNIW